MATSRIVRAILTDVNDSNPDQPLDRLVLFTTSGVPLDPNTLLSAGTGSATKVFVGPEADIQPLIDALPANVEYIWTETDGDGTVINQWAEVTS